MNIKVRRFHRVKETPTHKRVIETLCLTIKTHKLTSVAKPLLHKRTDDKKRDLNIFHCRSVIRMLQCMSGQTRSNASIDMRQEEKMSNDPKDCQDSTVKRVSKNL